MPINRGHRRVDIFKVLIIAGFILTLLVLRIYEPWFKLYSGGTAALDMRFGYNAADAAKLIGSLGEAGRIVYMQILCVDFLFIACFAMVQNFILKWVMGDRLLRGKWNNLLVIAYLRGFCDFIENTLILTMLLSFPSELPELAAAAGFATSIKFILLGLWLIAIPVAFIVRVFSVKAEGSSYKDRV